MTGFTPESTLNLVVTHLNAPYGDLVSVDDLTRMPRIGVVHWHD